MKGIVLSLTLVAALQAVWGTAVFRSEGNELLSPEEKMWRLHTAANMDHYFDAMVGQLRQGMKNVGLDPMELPDMEDGFSVKIVLVTWQGKLALSSGWLQDLATLSRSGDVLLNYDHELLRATAEFKFDDLLINYDYWAEIMNLGPSGQLEAKLKDFRIYIDILADLETGVVSLQDFQITETGSLSLKLKGHPILDIIGNAMTKVATKLLKGVIMDVVSGKVKTILEETLAKINVHPHFPDN